MHDRRKVELLLAAGADADATGDWGFTPLLMASLKAGARESVELLLERGASVRRRAIHGAVPRFGATSRGDFQTVQLLLHAGAEFDQDLLSMALAYAANCGDVDSVRALIALGATRSGRGVTRPFVPLSAPPTPILPATRLLPTAQAHERCDGHRRATAPPGRRRSPRA